VQIDSLPVSNTTELGTQKGAYLEDCKVLLGSKDEKIWLAHTKFSNDEFIAIAKEARDLSALKLQLKIVDLTNCKRLWKFDILMKNIEFEKVLLFWQDFNLLSKHVFDEQTLKDTYMEDIKLINKETQTTDG